MRTTGITSVPDPDESGFLSPDPSVNKLLGSKLSFVLVKDEPDQIVRVQNMKYKKIPVLAIQFLDVFYGSGFFRIGSEFL